jgi:hypothetical protein
MSLRGAKRRSNLMVIDEIATLPTVARNDKRGLRHSLDSSARRKQSLRFAATRSKCRKVRSPPERAGCIQPPINRGTQYHKLFLNCCSGRAIALQEGSKAYALLLQEVNVERFGVRPKGRDVFNPR